MESNSKKSTEIFITIPWFYPAFKAGGPIQSVANMIDQLGTVAPRVDSYQEAMVRVHKSINDLGNPADKEAQHNDLKFKIFCGNKDLDGTLLEGVANNKWIKFKENAKVWYSSDGKMTPVLKAEKQNESPDILFIIGIFNWQYNFKALTGGEGLKKIISVRGMLHPGALSQKWFKKKIYLQLWKLLRLHKKYVFHATNTEEKKYIENVFGKEIKVMVAGNFPKLFPIQPVTRKQPGCLKLVSVALISAMKNITLVLEALKSCELLAASGEHGSDNRESSVVSGEKGDVSRIEYNIYGPIKDKKYWEECEALIKRMPANIRVNYHGVMAPDKIVDALADNHVFILPSKSENFGHAIYEALRAGRPVITSNNTPWNNLQAAHAGVNISLTDKAEMVQAIEFFARMNQGRLKEWSAGARAYSEKAVDVVAIRKQYEEMFSS